MNTRLIRVVTSQFAQLQGLNTAAFGLQLLLFDPLTPDHRESARGAKRRP